MWCAVMEVVVPFSVPRADRMPGKVATKHCQAVTKSALIIFHNAAVIPVCRGRPAARVTVSDKKTPLLALSFFHHSKVKRTAHVSTLQ